MEFTEIERKFLITGFPTDLEELTRHTSHIFYLSVDPEIRASNYFSPTRDDCQLTVKSAGTFTRREVMIALDRERFDALKTMVPHDLIVKDYRRFALPDGNTLECSQVDPGSPTGFYYAEVEFESEEAARGFHVEQISTLIREVTDDPSWKMKNYWRRTRLGE